MKRTSRPMRKWPKAKRKAPVASVVMPIAATTVTKTSCGGARPDNWLAIEAAATAMMATGRSWAPPVVPGTEASKVMKVMLISEASSTRPMP